MYGYRTLTHETTEPLERPRDSHMGVDLDESVFGGVNVYLKKSRLVQWRVKKGEEALRCISSGYVRRSRKAGRKTYLMSDIRPGIRDVPACFGEDALMVVAVEEGILGLALPAVPSLCDGADLVGFETGLLEDNEKSSLGGSVRATRDVGLFGKHGRIVKHLSGL